MAVQVPDIGTITRNPLEPLSAEEIRRVSEIVREQRDIGPQVRFVTIALHEPPKQDVLEHDRTGGRPPSGLRSPSSTTVGTSRRSRRWSPCPAA